MKRKKPKLMERIWQNFIVSMPVLFKDMRATETSFKELKNMLDDFQNLRDKYLGYGLANNPFVLEKGGEYFTLLLTISEKTNKGDFYLWFRGEDSLCHLEIEDCNKPPTEEFIEEVDRVIDLTIEGKIPCSGCGATMNQGEFGGKYYAGIYCKNCWESKWRAIEARENYN